MKAALSPYLISARIFGFNAFHHRVGRLQSAQFVVITLVLTGCCLYRSLVMYRRITNGIASDDYEDATMAAIAGLRFIILSFSSIPIFNMQRRTENTQIFSHLLKLKRRIQYTSDDPRNTELRFVVRVFIYVVWVTLLVFVAKQMILWERKSKYSISESEFILIYRALQCLIEGEMVILVWQQQHCLALLNKQIQSLQENRISSAVRLQRLRRVHMDLCSLADRITVHYQGHLAYSWMANLIDAIESAYYGLVESLNLTQSLAELRLVLIPDTASWLLAVYVRLLHLTWTCSCATSQVNATRNALLKLEFRTRRSTPLREELLLFREQLMHTEMNYYIYGLTLNLALIYMITGVVASYMLVLVQFHTISHASEECASNQQSQN